MHTRTTRWRRHRREQTPLVLPVAHLIADQCTHQTSHAPRVPLLVVEVRIVEQTRGSSRVTRGHVHEFVGNDAERTRRAVHGTRKIDRLPDGRGNRPKGAQAPTSERAALHLHRSANAQRAGERLQRSRKRLDGFSRLLCLLPTTRPGRSRCSGPIDIGHCRLGCDHGEPTVRLESAPHDLRWSKLAAPRS